MKKSAVIFLFIIFLITEISSGQDKTPPSCFRKQNAKRRYWSFSGGMGVNESNDPSLKYFIEYQIPGYGNLTNLDKLSALAPGVEFFGGVEHQLDNDLAVKFDYSYFMKSYNVSNFPNYDFSYVNHQFYISLFYVVPDEYSFVKFGAGIGYVMNLFNLKDALFTAPQPYYSNGIGVKGDLILNFQIGKSFGIHLGGNVYKLAMQNLKDTNGNLLQAKDGANGGTGSGVNLNSLGFGLRLGLEYFIF